MSTQIAITGAGQTHVGLVREANEDAVLLDPEIGFWAVLDGMGGHSAGDVASSTARDVIAEFVRARRTQMPPRELLIAALNAASAAVHGEAQRRRDRHGMGTTAVLLLKVAEDRFMVAHVGDSRAYLFRDRRLTQLTRDHTVVAELLANGAISPEDAMVHPYKSVLSRNLGAKPEARPDVNEVQLQPGDRLLVCSDGLTGFTSIEAIEQTMSGVSDLDQACADLIQLALAGGGGDNVTVIVLEAGKRVVPRATQIIRTSGATEWWRRRELFLAAARERGLPQSPICAVLSADEALEIVAGNLCEAVYHDLEQTTGINVWTYAQNLAKGWFDQGGGYEPLRDLLDILRGAAGAVVADIAAGGQRFSINLEIAVTRALVVAEMAVGGLVAEQLRAVEHEMVQLSARIQQQQQVMQAITDQATTPYMPAVKVDPPPPDVLSVLESALAASLIELERQREKPGARQCLQHAHDAAIQLASASDAVFAARELYGTRTMEEKSLSPLFDALDQARGVHLQALRAIEVSLEVKAAAMRRVVAAHEALFRAVAGLVVESGHPVSDVLHEAAEETGRLRARLGQGEAKITQLDRELMKRSHGGVPSPVSTSEGPAKHVAPVATGSGGPARGKGRPKRAVRSTQIGHAPAVADFDDDSVPGTEVDRNPFGAHDED